MVCKLQTKNKYSGYSKFLFEAKILKTIKRSGFAFLGFGKETVAEHSFLTSVIAYIFTQIEKDIDPLKLITMALLHDISEARCNDANYVHKKYLDIKEGRAIKDASKNLINSKAYEELINEFNEGKTKEAILAKDADQISFLLELKSIKDVGIKTPDKWIPYILDRLKSDASKELAKSIMETDWDSWWFENYSE